MCGIAGFNSRTDIPLSDMREVLNEIGIRGIHSTGISLAKDDQIVSKIEKVPYYDFEIPEVSVKSAIFHTRYSTSNIEFPQPVYNSNVAIAHNGVVTQTPFERWREEFGYSGTNECDTSLLIGSDPHPLVRFPESSFAVAKLFKQDVLSFYRNEQRPLYYVSHTDITVVGSTKRSIEYFGKPVECKPCVVYTSQNGCITNEELMRKPKKDLQYEI